MEIMTRGDFRILRLSPCNSRMRAVHLIGYGYKKYNVQQTVRKEYQVQYAIAAK